MINERDRLPEEPSDRRTSLELASMEQLFAEIERRSFAYVLGAHHYVDGGDEEALMSMSGEGTQLVMVGALLENYLQHNPHELENFQNTTMMDFVGQMAQIANDEEGDDGSEGFHLDEPEEGPDGYR